MKRKGVLLLTMAALILSALPLFAATTSRSITTNPNVKEAIVKEELTNTGLTPSDIIVHKGQKITFELIAMDAEHGFRIDAYNVNKVVQPNAIEKITIDATTPGVFPITSSLSGDTMMKGELRVLTK
jgi:heme/copper-type cytochrome/quinol oxidase subunit 2